MKNISDLYKVVKSLKVSEKSARENERNTFVFEVDNAANKRSVADAVELFFNVKVKRVNTVITKGKKKYFRGSVGVRSNVKKAYVTLADGYSIDAFGAE